MAGELRLQYAAWAADAAKAAATVFHGRFEGAIVFGSVGRGTPHDGSDIDILLVVSGLPIGRAGRAAAAADLEAIWRSSVGPAAPELSVLLRSPDELLAGFPLLLEIVEDGRVLADPHGTTANILEHWRGRLTQAKAKRVQTGESWHWDLQGESRPGGWEL